MKYKCFKWVKRTLSEPAINKIVKNRRLCISILQWFLWCGNVSSSGSPADPCRSGRSHQPVSTDHHKERHLTTDLNNSALFKLFIYFLFCFFSYDLLNFRILFCWNLLKKKEDKKQSKVQIYCTFHVKWNTSNVTFAIDSLLNTIQVKVLVYIWAYTDIDTVCWMSLSLSIGADAMAEWDGHAYRGYGLIWKSPTLKDSLLTHQAHY